MKQLSLAIVQNSAGRDVAANLHRLDELTADINDVDLIALPEVFSIRGSDEDYRNCAEPLDGPSVAWLKQLAKRTGAWVLGGSIVEADSDHTFNTSVLVSREGVVAASYRKIHLFEATLDTGEVIREHDAYSAGNTPCLADVDGWKTGFSICYDLRFPELYRHYSARGAGLLCIPSNFTQRTGKDHWCTLVRARAIENQCFVIAPDQCGTNEATGVESYGHSMIVGPWGEVICEAGNEEAVITAVADPAAMDTVRGRVPVLTHRNTSL